MKALALALLLLPGGLLAARAGVWMTPEQAAEKLFPGSPPRFEALALDAKALASLKEGVTPHSTRGRGWTLPGEAKLAEFKGGWLLLVDEIGKHQPIHFAVAIDRKGTVLGVEVLEYRENYGEQIGRAPFLAQFKGKRWEDSIQVGGDIDAISGATYSCYATTRAVRKALALLRVSGRLP